MSFGDYGVDVEHFVWRMGAWHAAARISAHHRPRRRTWEPSVAPNALRPLSRGAGRPNRDQLFFAQEPIQREVETYIMNPTHLDGGWGSFVIPPNQVTTFHGSMPIPEDMSLITSHHTVTCWAKAWEVFARSQDAQDTIPLISIPDWDFNWQGIFTYPQMVHLPAGYILEAYSTYDNTADNPFNPNDPPETMWWGDFTTEEMFVLFLQGVPYEEGDEDIALHPRPKHHGRPNTTTLFPAWPNPVAQRDGLPLASSGRGDLVALRPSGTTSAVMAHGVKPPRRKASRVFFCGRLDCRNVRLSTAHVHGHGAKRPASGVRTVTP